MDTMARNRIVAVLWLLCPLVGWMMAMHVTYPSHLRGRAKLDYFFELAQYTPHSRALIAGVVAGFVVAGLLTWMVIRLMDSPFGGRYFSRFLRGTKIVSFDRLRSTTRERKTAQVAIGGVPIPTRVEATHFLIAGATGAGKSVAIRSLAYTIRKRGDRMIAVDPNGDLLSTLYLKGDRILNPYDGRTEGWSIFNELRNPYDYKRYALSLVPRGASAEEEEWAGFARLLVSSTARRLVERGTPSIQELIRRTTLEHPASLHQFLAGTDAESLFVGADKALASARFMLADKITSHRDMPPGTFSIRDFLEHGQGSLFIPWREDMAEAMKPLLSTWVDVICTSILSTPEDTGARIWLLMDELASLDKLPSLQAALTKGRKHGLRVVGVLHAPSELDNLYGRDEAETLRASMRSLIVLGGSKSSPSTTRFLSDALGQHEVTRTERGMSSSPRSTSRSRRENTEREAVVMPEEIASLGELGAYIAFSGDFPIAKGTLPVLTFKEQCKPFVERPAPSPAGSAPVATPQADANAAMAPPDAMLDRDLQDEPPPDAGGNAMAHDRDARAQDHGREADAGRSMDAGG